MAVLPRNSVDYQLAHLDQDYTKNLSGFYIVLVFVAAACMAMRVFARKIMKCNLERDDWTFLAGSALAEASFVVSLIYTFDAGLGKHWVALTPDQKILFPKLNYAFNILNLACYPIIKLSILLLYLRIFASRRTTVNPRFRQACWAGIIFISAMCIANTLVAIFACTPVRSFYDATVPGKCINAVPFYWATAVLNVVTDVYILILPLPVVWRLEIPLKRKFAISAIFMLGGLTFVVSIMRVVYYLDYEVDDPSYSFLRSAYATPAEVCLAIVVASAPTWRPVRNYFVHVSKSLYLRLRSSDASFDLAASREQARTITLASSYDSGVDVRTQDSGHSRKTSATYVDEEQHISKEANWLHSSPSPTSES